ncbi:MAG: hypothetical protein E5X49_33060 [Mesorhizobium sp.]|nr:MAG: hypothetical protein E5X49_33060 [Mesorhizobium sp.]
MERERRRSPAKVGRTARQRKRGRTRQGFRSVGSSQYFVSIFSVIRNLVVPSAPAIWPRGEP